MNHIRQATPGNTSFEVAMRNACIKAGDKIHTVPSKDDHVKNVASQQAKPAMKKQAVQKKVATVKPAAKKAVVKKPVVKKAAKSERQPISNASPTFISVSGKDVQVMSHEAMQREMANLNVAAEQAEAVKPAPQVAKQAPRVEQSAKIAAAKPQGNDPVNPAMVHHQVNLAGVDEFVLSLTMPRKFVPEGIQVIPAGAPGVGSASQQTGVQKKESFNKVKVDLGGLMARISVKGIHVAERDGSCRIYMNCVRISPEDKAGFNAWAGPYEQFIQKSLSKVWGKGALKSTEDGKEVRLELNYATGEKPATQIHFAINH